MCIYVPPTVSSKAIFTYALEIDLAFKDLLSNVHQNSKLIQWVFPNPGEMKLNTDGCWYDSNRAAGFGGIFWDDQGRWLLGYYGRLSCSSSLEVELWGIYKGLAIILEKGMTNVKIESDALVAVNLINEGANLNHPLSTIIQDAKTILNGTNSHLVHVYRDANKWADHLARIGVEQDEDFKLFKTSPPSIREFLIGDDLNLRQFLD